MEVSFLMCHRTLAGCCRRAHQSLQKYEKTENNMLVCTDCPQPPLVRSSRSQEHCARKCKKVKKNFNCRWEFFSVFLKSATCFVECHFAFPVFTYFCVYQLFISQLLPVCFYRAFNFQRHNRKCHLLPFDRFTHGVQKQPNTNFTLYEKKGKCQKLTSCTGVFLMRTGLLVIVGCCS